MTQRFGKFIERQAGSGEYLKIGFSPSSIPLQQRWRNNGLSADFLADYLSTFFPGEDPDSAERQTEIKDAVSYIANELLENAMKFSFAPSQHSVSIEMFLEADVISLYATNNLDPSKLEGFQAYIQRLLTEDLDELYMEQIERNAEADNEDASGLGFLTMLNDYGAALAWEFSDHGESGDGVVVTTMVQLTV
jgi:hypothetical protein